MSKYHNTKTTLYGIEFDSKAEANRYLVLRSMQDAGEISDLEVHTRWELLPTFVGSSGKTIRGIWYEDDFSYVQNGRRVVEDVKGFKTQAYRIKAKLFQHRYPDVLFVVVDV